MAALLFFCGERLTAALLIAALVHEAGHAAVICIACRDMPQIVLGTFGAQIVLRDPTGPWRELCCVLAGPVAGILPALICRNCAGGMGEAVFWCASILTLWNLLPVLPLDGGRAMRIFLRFVLPERAAEAASLAVSVTVACGTLAAGTYAAIHTGNLLLLPAAAALLITSCQTADFGVI